MKELECKICKRDLTNDAHYLRVEGVGMFGEGFNRYVVCDGPVPGMPGTENQEIKGYLTDEIIKGYTKKRLCSFVSKSKQLESFMSFGAKRIAKGNIKLTDVPSWTDYNQRMNDIYTKIASGMAEVKESGISPDPVVVNNQGGFIIAFRFPEDFCTAVAKISNNIGNLVPAISYDIANIHTTIMTYDVSDGFSLPDREILKKLTLAAEDALDRLSSIPPPVFTFNKLLYNKNCVLVPGQPDENFLVYTKAIVERSLNHDLEKATLPKIAHSTNNRFTSRIEAEKLEDFFSGFENINIRLQTTPDLISVGWFVCEPDKFIFHNYNASRI